MNFSRIVLGLMLIVGAGGALASGTSAFFSDTESSTGNMFTAGDIDLKIDNDSYYNGNRCTNVGTAEDSDFQWAGESEFPEPGTDCSTSFPPSDLDSGLLFFNFTDVKPSDDGEDTISIHAGSNEAYACLDMALTSNDDTSTVDPETDAGDAAEDVNDTWDGELAQNLQMFWWADDGDNVYEAGESSITEGVLSVSAMFGEDETFTATLADSEENIWGETGGIPGGETRYIAKAWCFGNLAMTPLPDDTNTGPQARPGFFSCDGSAQSNITQTDGITLDVAFRAIQTRHNNQFQCDGVDETPRTATLTVTKVVTNDNGGNNIVADFQLFADNGETEIPMTSGSPTVVLADTYTITETGISGYVASFSGDCNSSGQITLAPGENKTCTITNNDLSANITLIKNVVNDNGGTATANSAWGLRIDGNIVPNNTSVAVSANTPHVINEDGRAGYAFQSITGNPKCPAVLGGTATLDEGESITCTITNNDTAPLTENFGTGTCLQDIPGWDEDPGEACPNGTVAAAISTNDNTASPDGGRFGLLGNAGYICRAVSTVGLQNLVLNYYWRGDSDAEVGDAGSIRYYTGGTCAAPTGEVSLVSHPLTTTSWSTLQAINLPPALNNTNFFIRFTADTNNGNESFRVDGISMTGTPI